MNLTNERAVSVGLPTASGSIKIIILAVIGIVFALGFSWFFKAFLISGAWLQLLWSSLLAIGFLVIFTLQTFFIRSTMHFAFAFFLQGLALVAFFFTLTVPIITLFVVVYAWLLSASHSGRKVLENMLKIDFWSISRLVVPKGIMAITLLASVFIPLHLRANPDTLPLSMATFNKVLASSNGFVRYFYADFDSSKSVDEVARSVTEQKIEADYPQVKNLPPRERTVIVNEAVRAMYSQLFAYTGVQINPKDSIAAAAYTVLQEKFTGLSEEIKLWIFIIFGSVIFISVVSIMMPLRILVALLSFFVYETLIALGFARVVVESKPKEVLVV